jgi:hypothetical protein
MKIKFLIDFGGRETNEIHYVAGQIVEDAGNLASLAERGIVEILDKPAPVIEVPEPPKKKAGKK